MIQAFLSALQFLTILPITLKQKADDRKTAIMFPVAGLVIGIILYISNIVFRLLFPGMLADTIVVLIWVIITGGLHLDGLSDLADGVMGGKKDKQRILDIMKDSRIGAMGAIAIAMFLILKVTALHDVLFYIKGGTLLVLPVIARAGIVLLARLLPYARQEGTGKNFVQQINTQIVLITAGMAFIASLFLLWKGIVVFACIYTFIYLFHLYLKRRIGGITGDMLGAGCEISELLGLLIIVSLGKFG